MFLFAIILVEAHMILKEIKQINLFSQLDEHQIKKHIQEGLIRLATYPKASIVYHRNDFCQSLDIVHSGTLMAYVLSEAGSQTAMFEFKENSIIGGNLLFGDYHAYPFTIISETCQLFHIHKKAILEYLQNYHFVLNYVKSLSLNSQNMNQKITMVTENTLRDNILIYLRQQAVIQKNTNIFLPISKKEWANFLGIQRPSLFRELKKLKDEGLIDIDNRWIQLKEP